jgi:parallel beta-helix repeat protein
MDIGKYRTIVFSLAVGAVLVGGVLWLLLLQGTPHVARAADGNRYVAPDGDDGGQCDSVANRCRTVQRAIDVASPFDQIWVATGTYTDAAGTVAVIEKTVTLLGGWDSGFTTREASAYPTTLDAQRNGRVVYINGEISPTVDGFTITGGNANSEAIDAGCGGGIYSRNASPIIQNNVVITNVGSVSPTAGSGGGIYLESASASALISGNQVLSNSVHSTWWDRGGGGISLYYSDATVQSNRIQGNTCDRGGGGLHSLSGSPRILENEIRANAALNGGGIYTRQAWPLIQRNLIVDNVAGYSGGGINAAHASEPTIIANRIFSNTGSDAGGLVIWGPGLYTVTDNFVAHNDDGGIMVAEHAFDGVVAHNTVAFNIGSDGGIGLSYPVTPTVVNNILVSNTYGIYAHTNASGTLDYNDVWGNTAQDYELPGALEPGPHDIQADPLFVDPAGDDYHVRAGSPCVDAGTGAGVTADIDGDTRPMGAGYDIGADEVWPHVYLPLVMRGDL